jgi:hypothetical protein
LRPPPPRLAFDCPRYTTDIDYVFVPFRSKNDLRARVEAVLAEIEGAEVSISAHSKMLRVDLRVDAAAIQIEANVALDCPSTPVATARFALAQGQPSRIVRVMALGHALAQKLAAWNERRLLRDLYDCYYLSVRLGATPETAALDERLGAIESKLPRLRKRKKVTRAEFAVGLRAAADSFTDDALRNALAPVLPPDELDGLAPRLRSATIRLAEGSKNRIPLRDVKLTRGPHPRQSAIARATNTGAIFLRHAASWSVLSIARAGL